MPMRFFPDVLTHVNQNSSNAYSKFPTLDMMGCKCFGLFCSTFCRQTQLIETKFACAMPRTTEVQRKFNGSSTEVQTEVQRKFSGSSTEVQRNLCAILVRSTEVQRKFNNGSSSEVHRKFIGKICGVAFFGRKCEDFASARPRP